MEKDRLTVEVSKVSWGGRGALLRCWMRMTE